MGHKQTFRAPELIVLVRPLHGAKGWLHANAVSLDAVTAHPWC
jgi:hypothetical protein